MQATCRKSLKSWEIIVVIILSWQWITDVHPDCMDAFALSTPKEEFIMLKQTGKPWWQCFKSIPAVTIKWATAQQNQQNDLCAQRRLRSAWASIQSDQSSLSIWRNLGPLATHWAHNEDSDQTGRMPTLIWVFAGCTSFCWFCRVQAQMI